MKTINKNLQRISRLLDVLESDINHGTDSEDNIEASIETINMIRKLIADEQNKNPKVYLINIEEVSKDTEDKAWSVEGLSDEEFMTEAERQGNVYSVEGFEKAFNDMEINTFTDVIKIIG